MLQRYMRFLPFVTLLQTLQRYTWAVSGFSVNGTLEIKHTTYTA